MTKEIFYFIIYEGESCYNQVQTVSVNEGIE